ncbi:MAG: IPT/TIG domain protein [Acidobacteria bacterium OLB17]|nr:MAG: IPT/TIG domain protein [Acidobacteria bacterium OLB17]MCZ2390933.1 IPT/TIG domain-containing protein [Acidobacteriota bacterium]
MRLDQVHRYGSVLTILLVVTFTLTANAQRQSFFVAPQATDPTITTNLNGHYVSIDRSVAPKNQLFVFFPGTHGIAANYEILNNTVAEMGFHAINLTYPNDEPVNQLCGGTNTDLDCYANVRLEIIDGTDRTPLVNVDRANSAENRIIKLLIYLRNQYPADNWGQFLIDDSTINWSKIIVSGHSQGGGHAGIIGRYHSVARVVMFAAMDFNGRTQTPANWIARPETTPNASSPDKFWGFSHTRDEAINFTRLTSVIWPAYGMPQFGPVVNVDGENPPYGNTHSLTSNIECPTFHGCVAVDSGLVIENGVPVFTPVWQYLFSNTVSPLNLSSIQFLRAAQPVGRPPVGISTKYYRIRISGTGFDTSSQVFVNGVGAQTVLVSADQLQATLPAGKIGSVGNSSVQVRGSNGAVSNVLAF